MVWKAVILAAIVAFSQTQVAFGDELTQIVQKDLITLGYDPGPPNGNANTKTIIAVSRFQTEHGLEATGEITPQLAGVIQAAITQRDNSPSASQASNLATLQARQQACLQEKAEAARQANALKSGFGKLLSAFSRTSSQFGDGTVASEISGTTRDIYSVNASMTDLEGAAKDLGISESDVEACRNP